MHVYYIYFRLCAFLYTWIIKVCAHKIQNGLIFIIETPLALHQQQYINVFAWIIMKCTATAAVVVHYIKRVRAYFAYTHTQPYIHSTERCSNERFIQPFLWFLKFTFHLLGFPHCKFTYKYIWMRWSWWFGDDQCYDITHTVELFHIRYVPYAAICVYNMYSVGSCARTILWNLLPLLSTTPLSSLYSNW